jgi:hypothetical protein
LKAAPLQRFGLQKKRQARLISQKPDMMATTPACLPKRLIDLCGYGHDCHDFLLLDEGVQNEDGLPNLFSAMNITRQAAGFPACG